MKTVLAGLVAVLALAPVAASARYYEGGYGPRRHHDHVEVYRHGNHEDVVVRHHHSRGSEGRRYYGERPHHHHHFDD